MGRREGRKKEKEKKRKKKKKEEKKKITWPSNTHRVPLLSLPPVVTLLLNLFFALLMWALMAAPRWWWRDTTVYGTRKRAYQLNQAGHLGLIEEGFSTNLLFRRRLAISWRTSSSRCMGRLWRRRPRNGWRLSSTSWRTSRTLTFWHALQVASSACTSLLRRTLASS